MAQVAVRPDPTVWGPVSSEPGPQPRRSTLMYGILRCIETSEVRSGREVERFRKPGEAQHAVGPGSARSMNRDSVSCATWCPLSASRPAFGARAWPRLPGQHSGPPRPAENTWPRSPAKNRPSDATGTGRELAPVPECLLQGSRLQTTVAWSRKQIPPCYGVYLPSTRPRQRTWPLFATLPCISAGLVWSG